jgi:hypothetical protein
VKEIDPELLKRLDAIAAKLGVGAGEAWRIFIHQAYVEAWTWLPFVILWTVVTVMLLKVAAICRRYQKDQNEDLYGLGAVVCYLACVGSSAGIATCISSMVLILANPEAYALREILYRLRP